MQCFLSHSCLLVWALIHCCPIVRQGNKCFHYKLQGWPRVVAIFAQMQKGSTTVYRKVL